MFRSLTDGDVDARRTSRRVISVLLIATFLGFFFAAQIYFSAASVQHAVSWWQALYWAFGDWYEWALLSPLIVWVSMRFQFDRVSWRSSLLVHCLSGLLLSGFHATLCAMAAVFQGWFTATPVGFGSQLQKILANRTHFNLAVYAVIVCAWNAWEYHRKFRDREAETTELSSRLAQAQLQALRMQLNPHFLFNTLNAVSSLMLRDVNAANKMIVRLGDLLRLALESSDEQEVSLKRELDFLRHYLEIEKMRFGDRLQVTIEIEPGTLDATVPNLILQPLVENAIRHAIESQKRGGQIELRSARNNGSLVLQVSDTGRGTDTHESATASTREQIGLKNTRQRLEKLYGEAQGFNLAANSLGGMTAHITIPFRIANATTRLTHP